MLRSTHELATGHVGMAERRRSMTTTTPQRSPFHRWKRHEDGAVFLKSRFSMNEYELKTSEVYFENSIGGLINPTRNYLCVVKLTFICRKKSVGKSYAIVRLSNHELQKGIEK